MMLIRNAAALTAALAAAACQTPSIVAPAVPASPLAPKAATPIAPVLATADAVDVHSYARPLEARVTHVSLDLGVNFEAKQLSGQAVLDIARRPGASEIVLDDKGLVIQSITDAAGSPLQYSVGTADPQLGAPLRIALRPDTSRIVIRYTSAPEAGALQWLNPEQTAGKRYPYLLSQGQAIENRTWIPTQDSPGIRQTWDATIRVPAPLTAVMSAQRAAPGRCSERGECLFQFKMDKPVAPYLIALAVGDLKFQPLGPRSGVWTEPTTLLPAARELEDTEKMIGAAEALFGPYLWNRYDMLVLPPSFPFGGMENPMMTFLTPTFIAGDKSLVSLIAHELAHSWSGNLATNATWSDFWLNEGMTTYATYRIIESLYGPKVAAQQYALGWDSLHKEIDDLGGMRAADTRLYVELKGRNPDDGLTEIAYEKGAAFLRTIETAVGRERFDTWLKGWFQRHQFQPVTSAIFLADIRHNLIRGDSALERRLMLEDWVYKPGIPANAVKPDASAFAEVDAAVARFTSAGTVPAQAWAGWTTDERLRFVNRLPRKLSAARLRAIDTGLALSGTGNNEVLFAWLSLAVANRYDPAVPALERFLTTQGRRKFVAPLIEALAKDKGWGRPIAVRIYRVARRGYHPITTRGLDKLGL